ncbi:helix-turn-helix transcriptional regulator [Actinomyces trachealis]|uniref:helix-turn-helix domain-containing protein n=1 Tax=Actinomyces trachealis TaxID=2763540 RepID=UPI0031450912
MRSGGPGSSYAARTRAGLPQTELARRMGTQQSVISAVENGGQPLRVDSLAYRSRTGPAPDHRHGCHELR